MRIVLDTDRIHPLVKRTVLFLCAQIAIIFVFAVIEACTGNRLTWWEGYTLGASAGFFTFSPIKL